MRNGKMAPWVGAAVLFAGAIAYFEHAEHAKIGQPCTTELAGECWGPDQRIYCLDGKWVAEPCRGPAGCRLGPNEGGKAPVLCDASRNREGDVCLHDGASYCAQGEHAVLRCDSHALRLFPCDGRCRENGDETAECVGAPK